MVAVLLALQMVQTEDRAVAGEMVGLVVLVIHHLLAPVRVVMVGQVQTPVRDMGVEEVVALPL